MVLIDLAVRLRLTLLHDDSEVQHEGVGRREIMAPVKMNFFCREGQFFHQLSLAGVLRILSLCHISCDKNVGRSPVLADQKNFIPLLVHADHADCCGKNREPEIPAFLAVGNIPFIFKILFCKGRPALGAVLQFKHTDLPMAFSHL